MSDVISSAAAHARIHPAHQTLAQATRALRDRLTHALAIEYDWRYHDGPEWAARYWQAFGDLAVDLADAGQTLGYRRILERERWRPLSSAEAQDVRMIFRGLIGLAHPDVVPAAAQDARAEIWRRILPAYRGGDRGALVAAWSEVRALVRNPGLLDDVVAQRAEHDRLAEQTEAADRHLAEMSQTFPFNMRDRLADARWVHRQRLALAQVRAFIQSPATKHAANTYPSKHVATLCFERQARCARRSATTGRRAGGPLDQAGTRDHRGWYETSAGSRAAV